MNRETCGPSPQQEIEHLAEQCATLLRENEQLRAKLRAIGEAHDVSADYLRALANNASVHEARSEERSVNRRRQSEGVDRVASQQGRRRLK